MARRAQPGRQREPDRPICSPRETCSSSAAGKATTPAPPRVPANANCVPAVRRAVRSAGLRQPLREDAGAHRRHREDRRPHHQPQRAPAAPLNVMGNPDPLLPGGLDEQRRRQDDHRHARDDHGKVTIGGTVPNSDWKYCGGGTFDAPMPVTVLPVQVCMKGGFDPDEALPARLQGKGPVRARRRNRRLPRRAVVLPLRIEGRSRQREPAGRPRQAGRSCAAARSRGTSPATSSTSA